MAGVALLAYCNRHIPDAEQVEFDKKFERASVLVKTCGPEPGVAVAVPMQVFRFEEKLWYRDRNRWRQIDGKPENVCDLLDIEKRSRAQIWPSATRLESGTLVESNALTAVFAHSQESRGHQRPGRYRGQARQGGRDGLLTD
jgi:hypothetical protein